MSPTSDPEKEGAIIAVHRSDTVGLKCPQPVLKMAVKAPDIAPGDVLEVLGDCPTFEKDLPWRE